MPRAYGVPLSRWKLDDPAGRGVDAVRPIRVEIENRIRSLPTDLGMAPGA